MLRFLVKTNAVNPCFVIHSILRQSKKENQKHIAKFKNMRVVSVNQKQRETLSGEVDWNICEHGCRKHTSNITTKDQA